MEQRDLLKKVTDAGVNIVTCGNCGSVFMHKIAELETRCPHCHYWSDVSDFPDLFLNEPDAYYNNLYEETKK